jgi:hypothetical protein
MIELLILSISHHPDDLAKTLKRHLGRPATQRQQNLFRVRCHTMIEAEELNHRLPQVIGDGVSIGIADWENCKLTGGDDVRLAFMGAIEAPQPVELPEATSDPSPSTEEPKQEAPAANYPVINIVPVSREGMTAAPVPSDVHVNAPDAGPADSAVQ